MAEDSRGTAVGGLPLIVKPARAKDGAVPSVPSAAAPSAAARWIARSAPEAWWPPTAALWLRVRVNLPVLIAMLRAGRDVIHAVVSKGRSSGARCARSSAVAVRRSSSSVHGFFARNRLPSACCFVFVLAVSPHSTIGHWRRCDTSLELRYSTVGYHIECYLSLL